MYDLQAKMFVINVLAVQQTVLLSFYGIKRDGLKEQMGGPVKPKLCSLLVFHS